MQVLSATASLVFFLKACQAPFTLLPGAGDEVASGRSHYWLPGQRIRFLEAVLSVCEAFCNLLVGI